MKHLVAVYGTLKGGLGNSFLLRNSTMIGVFHSNEIDIYDNRAFPLAKPSPNGTGHSLCEVYQVDEETLTNLDILEGIDKDNGLSGLYHRKQINSPFGKAWVYIYNGSVVGKEVVANWREQH